MESVFNTLRTSVSSMYQMTSNISTTGNVLTREYDMLRHVASAGSNLTWKIYDAVKKSTKQETAIFVLEKKQLDKYSKKDKDAILEVIRKGVAQLTRLRHPSMLTIQHPLEETRDSLMFATEPVVASLANLLGRHENCPSPVPPEMDNFVFHDVEIKYGLLQLAEGLSFLHNDAKLLHRNVAPENVLVNKNGAWKLSGFDFAVGTQNSHETPLKFPTISLVNSDLPQEALPNMDYVAPEYFDRNSVEASADLFSLGALTYTLYNKGQSLPVEQLKKLPSSKLNCIPEDSRRHIKLLLSADPSSRPDAVQFSKLHFFEDKLVKALQYIDSLYQWDTLQKTHFYKGLPEVLAQMPKRVKLRRIVSGLAKDFVNPEMITLVLPNIFLIAEEASEEEFQKWIFPELIKIFKMQEPIQIGIILMQKMDLLFTKCKSHPEALKEHLVPCVVRLFACKDRATRAKLLQQMELFINYIQPNVINDQVFPHVVQGFFDSNPLIREQTVKCMMHLAPKLNYHNLNEEVLKNFARLQTKDEEGGIRTNTTVCLGKISSYFHPQTRQTVLIPAFLRSMRDPFPPARIAGILALAATQNFYSLRECATRVMPALCHLTMDPEKQVRDQAFKALKGFVSKLEKVSEDPSLAESMEADLNAAGSSISSTLASSWAGWAVSSLASKFYRSKATTSQSIDSQKDSTSKESAQSKLDERTTPPATTTQSESGESVNDFDDWGNMDNQDNKVTGSKKMLDGWDADDWVDEEFADSQKETGDEKLGIKSAESADRREDVKANVVREESDDFFSQFTNEPKKSAKLGLGGARKSSVEQRIEGDDSLEHDAKLAGQTDETRKNVAARRQQRSKDGQQERRKKGPMKLGAQRIT